MSKLPAITAREAIRAFQKAGFAKDRTTGSHVILVKSGHRLHLSIPLHKGKTLHPKIVKSVLRDLGITADDLAKLV